MNSIQDALERIKMEITTPFSPGGYWLSKTHIELGNSLHTGDFYFAKKFFQNAKNCDDLATLLACRLNSLKNLPEQLTLVGHGNYTGLFLRKTIEKLGKYNYAVIQQQDSPNEFSWQFRPTLNQQILIVLPITVTSNIYFRLKKFITNYGKKYASGTEFYILPDLVNVFLILDKSLEEAVTFPINIDEITETYPHAQEVYKQFNWVSITEEKIAINPNYTAHSLIRLFTELYQSETCELCFPVKKPIMEEKLLLPMQDHHQTPNLIFGFPNFGRSGNIKENFIQLFNPKEGQSAHAHGYLQGNNKSYDHFIRGSVFYENNKDAILKYFDLKINEFLHPSDTNIIFITSETRYNSSFIEDISTYPCLSNRTINIFRFQPYHEFFENFISLYSGQIKERDTKIIYFQEVLSAGREFKLISDYIKHIHDKGNEIGLPGFYLLVTLVNRMSEYTKNELIRKLFYKQMSAPEKRLLYFFHLNDPLIASTHVGDPQSNHRKKLMDIKKNTQLDTLKLRIQHVLNKTTPRDLYSIEPLENTRNKYFPSLTGQTKRDIRIVQAYHQHFNQYKYNLLLLYLTHLLNNELADPRFKCERLLAEYSEKPENFFFHIRDKLYEKFEPDAHNFFTNDQDFNFFVANRDKNEERELINKILMIILSKPPFIFYKTIYEAVFKVTLIELTNLNNRMAFGSKTTFRHFKKFKFYIRRSLELNSNFIISHDFIAKLKGQLTPASQEAILQGYEDKKKHLGHDLGTGLIQQHFYDLQIENFNKQKIDVLNYPFFVLLCFKEYINSGPSRSIRVETLVNSKNLQPRKKNKDIRLLMQDPYYHLITMLKVENAALLKRLLDYHKDKGKARIFEKYDQFSKLYLTNTKNDQDILNAQKFLRASVYKMDLKKMVEIRQSLWRASNAISALHVKKNNEIKLRRKRPNYNLNEEIKEILDLVIKVISPEEPGDHPNHNLQYIFCIEYRNRVSGDDGNNLYTIFSDEAAEQPVMIDINTKGLLYNLLYGLHANTDLASEQTFITTVMYPDGPVSFQKEFYYRDISLDEGSTGGKPNISVDISELYTNDIYNPQSGKGLPGLDQSQMTLAFRLSRPSKKGMTDGRQLEGQAVLLILNKEEPTFEKFERFMNAEKIRLLMLLKDDLLEYLQKQFENDTFIELLENRKREIYQRKLEHGLSRYSTIQRQLFDESVSSKDEKLIAKNKELYELIDLVTAAQLNFKKQTEIKEDFKEYKTSFILERMQDLFYSPCFVSTSIPKHEVRFSGFDIKTIRMKPSVLNVILTEMIINMKKYTTRQIDDALMIDYDKGNNALIFKNVIRKGFVAQNINKEYGGIYMCREIINKLDLLPLEVHDRQNGVFGITLNLNPRQYETK